MISIFWRSPTQRFPIGVSGEIFCMPKRASSPRIFSLAAR